MLGRGKPGAPATAACHLPPALPVRAQMPVPQLCAPGARSAAPGAVAAAAAQLASPHQPGRGPVPLANLPAGPPALPPALAAAAARAMRAAPARAASRHHQFRCHPCALLALQSPLHGLRWPPAHAPAATCPAAAARGHRAAMRMRCCSHLQQVRSSLLETLRAEPAQLAVAVDRAWPSTAGSQTPALRECCGRQRVVAACQMQVTQCAWPAAAVRPAPPY